MVGGPAPQPLQTTAMSSTSHPKRRNAFVIPCALTCSSPMALQPSPAAPHGLHLQPPLLLPPSPAGNRYVKYLRTIRAIQDYLCKTADKRAIPKVDNTNVDRSVATIHATLLGCLRRRAQVCVLRQLLGKDVSGKGACHCAAGVVGEGCLENMVLLE